MTGKVDGSSSAWIICPEYPRNLIYPNSSAMLVGREGMGVANMQHTELKEALFQFAQRVKPGFRFGIHEEESYHPRAKNGEGILYTTPEQERIIVEIRSALHKKWGKILGKDRIRKRLEDEIWHVLDVPKIREGSVESRAEEAARRILDGMNASTRCWSCWAGIGGIEAGEEGEFGGVWFGPYTDRDRAIIAQRALRPGRDKDTEKHILLAAFQMDRLQVKQIGKTDIDAYNTEDAQIMGERKIDLAASILAMFTNTREGQKSWIWGTEKDNNRSGRLIWVADEEGNVRKSGWTNRNMECYQLKTLMKNSEHGQEPYHEAVKNFDKSLRKKEEDRSEAERRVIEGGGSIGQAQTERDDRLSILRSVIGLEVLAGSGSGKGRRKVRKLLQKIFNPNKIKTTQAKIDKWIQDVYTIRNDIAHRGDTETQNEIRTVISEIALRVAVHQARCLPGQN